MSLRTVEEVSTQVPADDFQALEDKVYRTIELYKSAREARTIAERDVKRLREQLEEREEEVEGLRRETVSLRKEREDIRARVEIFDQGYNLRGTDPDYILKLAEYDDTKMRAVAEQTHTVDSARLAVLAALNIADEYHLLKRKMEGGGSESSSRTRQLLKALDEVLLESRRAG